LEKGKKTLAQQLSKIHNYCYGESTHSTGLTQERMHHSKFFQSFQWTK